MNLSSILSRISLIPIAIYVLTLLFAAPAFADCKSQPEWFPHSQTQEPDNAGFKSSSNCVFHQWAWQTFLWLTENVDGKPRFLSMVSPYSLLGMSAGGLMPRVQKSNVPESFNEYLQAGTDGIMVDQNGRAVYYSQYLNKDFVNFITVNKLTDPNVVRAFDPKTTFPIGAIELKASWKIVQPGEDTSDMFTMKGKVNRLVNKNGKIVIDPNKTETVQLALVGFHIAGVVRGHPEMIWATFEHKNNAPNVPEKFTPDTVISNRDWTFYKAGTTYENCNVNFAKTNKLKLDEYSQILGPVTQICRQYEFGNDPSAKGVQPNDSNIASLNADVLEHLGKTDVWRNYFEVGAIWFKKTDSLKPSMALDTDDSLTGSLKLSNSVVETYTQHQSTMNNCFRCHNTTSSFPSTTKLYPLPPLNLNISRAFQNIYFWSQNATEAK